ncbi:beta-ketoacyl reductase [Saccharopolyspora gregorii]|uniref:Carrier domain-containing protein n=1 Tax=Saccharopolyspora gregorii TaxID=33914 RepID=A0ABP6RHN5_9PSEU
MAAGQDAADGAQRGGVDAMRPDLALRALDELATGPEPAPLVAAVGERFARAFTATRPSPLLRELPGHAEHAAPAPADRGSLRAELAELPAGRRRDVLLDLVREHSADILGHPGPDSVGPDRAFRELGFDSLAAVELRNRARCRERLRLGATMVFDTRRPPADLAEHLLAELGIGGDPAADDADEARIRRLLATAPLSALRAAGVLEALDGLDGPGGEHADGTETGSDESIDAMALDDLVQAALDGAVETD